MRNKNRNENGITLMILVITIIILTIITSISFSTGRNSIYLTQYTILQTELSTIQTKINEISEYYADNSLGQNLTSENELVLTTPEVSSELTKKANNAGISLSDIKNDFKLFTSDSIKDLLEIDNISRNFLINTKYCIVISADVFKYNGVNYYMQEQMPTGLYNVTYNNQISTDGTFDVSTSKVSDINGGSDRYQINISVQHSKYVSKWQIKYKLQQQNHWETTNNTTFIVNTPGTYEIQVSHGNEINLGLNTITITP